MNQIKSRKGYKVIKGLFGKYEEIPEEWNIQNLRNVCDEVYRYPTYFNISYVKKGVLEIRGELILISGKLDSNISKYRLISKQTSSEFPRTILHEGDIVLSVRGTMGKTAIITKQFENSNITANLIKISPNQKLGYSKFLFYIFTSKSFQDRLQALSSQTTIQTIQSNTLQTIQFFLPLFIEQQKIASILSNVDTLIENTQRIIDTTIKLKKGLMQQLFTQGIGHTKFRKVKSLFGKYEEIPEKWECKKLENITEIFKGRGLSKGKISFQGKYKCVLYGELFTTYSQIIENIISKTDHFEGVLSQIGDILMPSSTTTKGIDLATSSVLLIDDIQLGGDINIIRPKLHSIDSVFLGYYLSNKLEKKIASIAQGFTIIHLYPKHLQKLEIYIPKEKKEQQKIGSILSNIDSLIQLQRNSKEKLERLKKSLMQKLLTGKVRVKI